MSKRISGVKNFVSNTGALLRGEPFSQVKSPKANGVKVSTPVVASGDWRAAGTTWFSVAADGDAAAGAGAAASEGLVGGTAAGTFITMSWRVALLATT